MAVYTLGYSGLEVKFSNLETIVLTTTVAEVGKISDMLTGTTFLGIGKYAVAGYLGAVFIAHTPKIKAKNLGKGVIIKVSWVGFISSLTTGVTVTSR